MSHLEALFNPKSVAVIGASKDPGKLGYILLKNVIDYNFKGNVYPVNPKADVILDRKAYPKISAIPDPVDLALLSIPSQFVLDAVEECSESKVKSVVILSSGFKEAGGKGEKIQAKIKSVCQSSGMRALGPNCMGIYNISGNLNGTYFWELPRILGNISFVSQSGAYGGILFNEIRQRQIGISKFVSIGNMVDLNHADLLRYLLKDKNTQVIALFIEGILDGLEFMKVASDVSKVKPIVAFKVGRSESGKRAARSHTGAMAGSYEVYEAAFKQSGVILTKNTEEFFDTAMALSAWHHSLPKNDKLAIMTISGGPCVVASDTCEAIGLNVPILSDETREQVRKYIPFFGADSNPVDMTPQMNPKNYEGCVETVFSQKDIGGGIAINCGLDIPEFGSAFVNAYKIHDKPVVSFTIDTPEISKIFYKNNIPIYPTPERSVHAYNGLVVYSEYLKSLKAKEKSKGAKSDHMRASTVLKKLAGEGKKVLAEGESSKVLEENEIPTCRGAIAKNIDEAIKHARDIGYPVVVKIHSSEISHKSEVGGVHVGLKDESELKEACHKLLKNFGKSTELLVQEFIPPGIELIIGGKRDPIFGPIVVFGLGGVFAELLKDISLRICPVDKQEAMGMVQEIKGFPLLKGFRGKTGANADIIADALVKASYLMLSNSSISELDINPLIAHEDRLAVVDSLIILKE
jgi:acetyltransferase